jgi:hypothetical protein
LSLIGILASNLFSGGAQSAQTPQSAQSAQNGSSNFQQIQTEFQQLGQDLQSGNLTQARQDFTTLSQNLSGASQTSAAQPSTNQTAANPALQAFAQLGTDLRAGNLQAAQQDYTTVQQDAQQNIQQAHGHHGHHHHHAESSQSSPSASAQQSAINTAFGTLGQDLQAGNLSGAQSAFATLTNDLRQIGGFLNGGTSGSGSTGAPSSTAGLNVRA